MRVERRLNPSAWSTLIDNEAIDRGWINVDLVSSRPVVAAAVLVFGFAVLVLPRGASDPPPRLLPAEITTVADGPTMMPDVPASSGRSTVAASATPRPQHRLVVEPEPTAVLQIDLADGLDAAKRGDLDALQNLLATLNSPDQPGAQGQTLLHAAAAYGESAAITSLISAGASVQVVNDRGATPLHVASRAAVTLLLSYGAEVDHRDNLGATPLHYASYDAAVELIAGGADLGAENKIGATPLLTAVRRGDTRLAELLIMLGASVNVSDRRQGVTPLHLAVKHGDPQLVAILVNQGADINARDKFGNTPLSWTRSPLTSAGGIGGIAKIAALLAEYGAY